jgi:hypothetical protein
VLKPLELSVYQPGTLQGCREDSMLRPPPPPQKIQYFAVVLYCIRYFQGWYPKVFSTFSRYCIVFHHLALTHPRVLYWYYIQKYQIQYKILCQKVLNTQA